MRRAWWIAVFLAVALLAGCSDGDDGEAVEAAEATPESDTEEAGDAPAPADDADTEEAGAETEPDAPAGDEPFISITDVRVEGERVVLDIEVRNFILDEEAIGMSNVPGTGHWHYYLNGELAELGVGDTVALEGLEPGVHHVRMSLHNNDHSPLSPPAEQDISVEVPAP